MAADRPEVRLTARLPSSTQPSRSRKKTITCREDEIQSWKCFGEFGDVDVREHVRTACRVVVAARLLRGASPRRITSR